MPDQPSADFRAIIDANLKSIGDSFGLSYRDVVRSMNRAAHLEAVAALLAIAESANPPQDHPDHCGDVRLDAKDGWKVVFHYGADGHLRYISEFVTPAGRIIDFWEWDEKVEGRDRLMAWSRVGDAARLVSA